MGTVINLPTKSKTQPARTDEERIARIRQSLDKINRLMAELKQLSGEKDDERG